jgi:hypothetical protein
MEIPQMKTSSRNRSTARAPCRPRNNATAPAVTAPTRTWGKPGVLSPARAGRLTAASLILTGGLLLAGAASAVEIVNEDEADYTVIVVEGAVSSEVAVPAGDGVIVDCGNCVIKLDDEMIEATAEDDMIFINQRMLQKPSE